MHYDDQVRQYNFVTGLASGLVLGAILALSLAPRLRGGDSHRLRSATDQLRKQSRARGSHLRDEMSSHLADALSGARSRFSR